MIGCAIVFVLSLFVVTRVDAHLQLSSASSCVISTNTIDLTKYAVLLLGFCAALLRGAALGCALFFCAHLRASREGARQLCRRLRASGRRRGAHNASD